MADTDPYAGIEDEDERRLVYQNLLKQHEQDEAEYGRKKEIYMGLEKDWDAYRQVQLHEDGEFNKYSAMFAAGSFGVSFAFIDKIAPFQQALHKTVLAAAWLCFAVTLVLNIAIHLFSSVIHGKYCDDVAENIRRGYEGKPFVEYKRWYYRRAMNALYALAFLGFLGGMVCLVSFVFLNASN
jgi:hypothetical protein